MAAYGTLRHYAARLGNRKAKELLARTLEEEKAADAKLNTIAKRLVNPEAEKTTTSVVRDGARALFAGIVVESSGVPWGGWCPIEFNNYREQNSSGRRLEGGAWLVAAFRIAHFEGYGLSCALTAHGSGGAWLHEQE